jgi:LDH2 family malate/lactate/ureidoglycolate dehydrogenase
MQTRSADELRALMSAILEGAGTDPDTAKLVGDSLVDANLAGHDSHGVIRVLHYVEMARAGKVDPKAVPTVLGTRGATARIDGGWGWGQPSMWLATRTAIDLARQFGLGAAAVTRSYHIGRVAPYVEAAAAEGMIGIAMSNAGPAVAPFGGRQRVMGTNPIAWAAPRGDGKPPICLDVATAAIAEGKVRVARAKGEPLPPGMIVDAEGHPSQNPTDFYDGGALLPFGLHKGSGFSILAQLIGVGLAGATPELLLDHRGGNGPFVLALDIASFAPLDDFVAAVETQAAAVNACEPADGCDRVFLPGEPEILRRAEREALGIPVPDRTWDDLMALAAELGAHPAGTPTGA